jgi:large subunit ribosomal protein L21
LTTSSDFPSPNPIPLIDPPATPSSPPAPPTQLSCTSPLAPIINDPNLYMTVHINTFPYLISPNDTLHLPFNLPDAPLGSILRMTTVSRIGVRDYTLQGHPFVDPKVFTLKMRVVEHTKMPMATTVKKKQRQRRARHLFNKQNYTVLK